MMLYLQKTQKGDDLPPILMSLKTKLFFQRPILLGHKPKNLSFLEEPAPRLKLRVPSGPRMVDGGCPGSKGPEPWGRTQPVRWVWSLTAMGVLDRSDIL